MKFNIGDKFFAIYSFTTDSLISSYKDIEYYDYEIIKVSISNIDDNYIYVTDDINGESFYFNNLELNKNNVLFFKSIKDAELATKELLKVKEEYKNLLVTCLQLKISEAAKIISDSITEIKNEGFRYKDLMRSFSDLNNILENNGWTNSQC